MATAVVLWIVEIKSVLPDTPVTIRYLGPNDLDVGSEKSLGVLSFAPDRRLKLWVTNHTQKILVIDIPKTNLWRLKVSVSEKLVGASYFFAGIKESLSALFFDHRLQNPFPRGLIYHGKSREVMSEEIYVKPTDYPPESLF